MQAVKSAVLYSYLMHQPVWHGRRRADSRTATSTASRWRDVALTPFSQSSTSGHAERKTLSQHRRAQLFNCQLHVVQQRREPVLDVARGWDRFNKRKLLVADAATAMNRADDGLRGTDIVSRDASRASRRPRQVQVQLQH